MYYAPEIFEAAGSGTDSAFVQTVTVGAINLLFTFVAILFVDKTGRKLLLIAGTAIQAASLALVGYLFHSAIQGWPRQHRPIQNLLDIFSMQSRDHGLRHNNGPGNERAYS